MNTDFRKLKASDIIHSVFNDDDDNNSNESCDKQMKEERNWKSVWGAWIDNVDDKVVVSCRCIQCGILLRHNHCAQARAHTH